VACEYEDLYKTVGNDTEIAGTVAICQTTTELTITFTVSGSREVAWFQQTGLGIYGQEPDAITPSPQYLVEKDSHHGDKLRSFTYTIPLSDLGEYGDPGDIIYIAAYAVVPGQDGVGGMVWAGDLTPPEKNPNTRYFSYTIKDCETPEEPGEHCLFTQGYWFAKPNVIWPSETVTIGGENYTKAEARAIFFGPNIKTGKTDAKQAFLQAAALQLNLNGDPGLEAHLAGITNTSDPCYKVLEALATINTYFSGKPKATPTTINNYAYYPKDSAIREAAEKISSCLNSDHCD
jgi:hypothetical protein